MRTDFKWHLFDLQKSYNDFFKNSILIIIIKLERTILWQSQMKWWVFFSLLLHSMNVWLNLNQIKGTTVIHVRYQQNNWKFNILWNESEVFCFQEVNVRLFVFMKWKWGSLFSVLPPHQIWAWTSTSPCCLVRCELRRHPSGNHCLWK